MHMRMSTIHLSSPFLSHLHLLYHCSSAIPESLPIYVLFHRLRTQSISHLCNSTQLQRIQLIKSSLTLEVQERNKQMTQDQNTIVVPKDEAKLENHSIASSPRSIDLGKLDTAPDKRDALLLGRKLSETETELVESLRFKGLEISVECSGTIRRDLFSRPEFFVALFSEGVQKGTWRCQERSEPQLCEGNVPFFKKFPLRAATELDRTETIIVAFLHISEYRVEARFSRAVAYQQFTVWELLSAKHGILEKKLRDARGDEIPARVLLAMDLVQNVEQKHTITIDFGCMDNSVVPNRVFFTLSRALQRGRWSPIYKSELKTRSQAGQFEPISLDSLTFHGGEEHRLFRLGIFRGYKNGKQRLLGFIQTSVKKLSTAKKQEQLYWWPTVDGITTAKVVVEDTKIEPHDIRFTIRMIPL